MPWWTWGRDLDLRWVERLAIVDQSLEAMRAAFWNIDCVAPDGGTEIPGLREGLRFREQALGENMEFLIAAAID
jgi:hypothetical protein